MKCKREDNADYPRREEERKKDEASRQGCLNEIGSFLGWVILLIFALSLLAEL
jgi:hypothetical protein